MSSSYVDFWPTLWRRTEVMGVEATSPRGLDGEPRKEYEDLLWSDARYTDTEKLIGEDWNRRREKAVGNDLVFRNEMLRHARVATDMSGYKVAVSDYQSILDRDRYFDKGKKNLGVDLNNLGVAYHLLATSINEPKGRSEATIKALENFKLAENEFRKENNRDALFINLANQYGLHQELHDRQQAVGIFSEIKRIDLPQDRDIRELVLEQQ